MSADITGSKGVKFNVIIDTATIGKNGAKLLVAGQPDTDLVISGDKHQATVPSLPQGNSIVSLALIWPPGAPDATIDVGSVSNGTAQTPNPKHTIDSEDNPGLIQLLGQ